MGYSLVVECSTLYAGAGHQECFLPTMLAKLHVLKIGAFSALSRAPHPVHIIYMYLGIGWVVNGGRETIGFGGAISRMPWDVPIGAL